MNLRWDLQLRLRFELLRSYASAWNLELTTDSSAFSARVGPFNYSNTVVRRASINSFYGFRTTLELSTNQFDCQELNFAAWLLARQKVLAASLWKWISNPVFGKDQWEKKKSSLLPHLLENIGYLEIQIQSHIKLENLRDRLKQLVNRPTIRQHQKSTAWCQGPGYVFFAAEIQWQSPSQKVPHPTEKKSPWGA